MGVYGVPAAGWFLGVSFLITALFLLLAGNMMAHGFTMSRTVAAAAVTVVAMAVIVFLMYLFFNLLFEVGGFAAQIYREIAFRT